MKDVMLHVPDYFSLDDKERLEYRLAKGEIELKGEK